MPAVELLWQHYQESIKGRYGEKQEIAERLTLLIMKEDPQCYWSAQDSKSWYSTLKFPENIDDSGELYLCGAHNMKAIDRWLNPRDTVHLPFTVGSYIARSLREEYRDAAIAALKEKMFPDYTKTNTNNVIASEAKTLISALLISVATIESAIEDQPDIPDLETRGQAIA